MVSSADALADWQDRDPLATRPCLLTCRGYNSDRERRSQEKWKGRDGNVRG